MAHFAEIQNNIVTRVLVVPDEQEHRGEEYLRDDLRLGGRWVQTSYNHRTRKQFAGIGYTYDEANDRFIAKQPYPSWTLDRNGDWQAPIPRPDGDYEWDEAEQQWTNTAPDE